MTNRIKDLVPSKITPITILQWFPITTEPQRTRNGVKLDTLPLLLVIQRGVHRSIIHASLPHYASWPPDWEHTTITHWAYQPDPRTLPPAPEDNP